MSATGFKRPGTEEELQSREAIGVIRASRFVRRYSRLHRPITVDVIREIHRMIFHDVWPDIAGEYRTEDLKITYSHHRPPHHTEIPGHMRQMDKDLEDKLTMLKATKYYDICHQHRPVKLVYTKLFRTRSAALKEEFRIKRLTRAEKLRLIHRQKS